MNTQLSLQPYDKWRGRLYPILLKTEHKNRHAFAENVDRALLNRKAFLFLSPDGFLVLKPFDGDKVCIMFAYSFVQGATTKYQPEIERLCRQIGAKQLVFCTALGKAFARVSKRLGYQLVEKNGHISTWLKELV
ncbi:hypothetical protein [Vibrio sp. ABG19]|uniref:hypothetical protein n=1 Tax=Vibrio sp. ABG19 TaxID=2817385 RepID=UPI00249EA191|nr:hypothetical protein [Vibrio sp. ABG19]WGY45224.1 hypothetical protein J0X00_05890 [Vibrio sp. ABG19]